ncbi:MAG: hypothetical protein A2X13_10640 [Bacteroidetes bacterium GWC2_33_15]|nr:MAG: hypothetical protein A2X10_03190 [Bacteroidetes bacterium GWA2_33_15]OFX48855.1 MAG: hypothetical protein A2X13_10640 [Bacteroidetes bacterium GWC2_33_15]OFX66098.1 MAG: hypothetical protein A2X15_11785 [Bacteroidetes bacterium GWB2_32_14]OFX68140.1 MAG: hypothetical protein A2X14_07110 [Bacteroidetes bacterium GWD2_33_33]HAN17912.1 hypothetical protein [Bacteroidales bacterium]
MKVSHTWIENNIMIEVQGKLDLKVLLEANAFMLTSPKFDLMSYQIFNFLEVESLDISHNEIKVFSMLQKGTMRWNNSVKIAMVAINPQIINGFGFYFSEMRLAGLECELFGNIDEALHWCTG